jgi:hypothetical protein
MNRQVDDRNLHTLTRTWSATRRALPAFAVLIAVLLVALPAHAQNSSSYGPAVFYANWDFSRPQNYVCGMGQSAITHLNIPFVGNYLYATATLNVYLADWNNHCPPSLVNPRPQNEPAEALAISNLLLYHLNNNTWQLCKDLSFTANDAPANTLSWAGLTGVNQCGSGWYGVYSSFYLFGPGYERWFWSGAIYVQ